MKDTKIDFEPAEPTKVEPAQEVQQCNQAKSRPIKPLLRKQLLPSEQ